LFSHILTDFFVDYTKQEVLEKYVLIINSIIKIVKKTVKIS
jgi:hypothetical protein